MLPTEPDLTPEMIQQRMNGGQPNVEYLSRALVYQALIDPTK